MTGSGHEDGDMGGCDDRYEMRRQACFYVPWELTPQCEDKQLSKEALILLKSVVKKKKNHKKKDSRQNMLNHFAPLVFPMPLKSISLSIMNVQIHICRTQLTATL